MSDATMTAISVIALALINGTVQVLLLFIRAKYGVEEKHNGRSA